MKWEPIESAPKDGTEILGANNRGVSVFHWDVQSYHKRPDPYWARHFHPVYFDRTQQPTHWMPLPPPPAVATDVREPVTDEPSNPSRNVSTNTNVSRGDEDA